MRKHLWAGAIFSLLTLSVNAAYQPSPVQAHLEFLDLPTSITTGMPFLVTVGYDTDLSASDERFVAILRLKPRKDGAAFREVVLDNDGKGFDSSQGSLTFRTQLTAPFFNRVYFEAYLAPFGMNEDILAMVRSYPTDGTYRYLWKGGTTGHTRDLFYLGKLLAKAQPGGSCYCCGLTFEVFLRAYEEYNKKTGRQKIGKISFGEMKKVRSEWYGSIGDRVRQCVAVMQKKNVGVEIRDKTRARAGDFCQIWRHSGSGHSVVFIKWLKDDSGKIKAIRYWSSQRATNGIGYRVEPVGPPKGVKLDKTFIGRIKKPRDKLDWGRRYTSVQAPDPAIIYKSAQ